MIRKTNYKKKAELSYDADDVNIRVQHFRIFKILEMLNLESIDIFDKDFNETGFWEEKGSQVSLFDYEIEGEGDGIEIDIDEKDDLQRNPGLWNTVQKSRFIESLMIRIPIPAFYFDGSQKPWRVVDGLQRLHTIRSFINNDFKLSSLEYLQSECDGRYYNDSKNPIPGYLKKRILNAEIIAYVINPGTPNNVKYNIFKRINTGGLQLNGQEIRNAFFPGKPAEFTKKLANLDEFKTATNFKVSPRRMVDREYALRFTAFQIFNYEHYNGKMDFFLSEAMNDLYDRDRIELTELEERFTKTMLRANDLFENHAFYRPVGLDTAWGRLPNKALFDTFSWNLNELTDRDFLKLISKKEIFYKSYRDFMINNEKMFKAINDTTGAKSAVINRLEELNYFLKNYIQ